MTDTGQDDLLTDALEVPVGEHTFEVAVRGPEDGIPVLLLHGFPTTRDSYARVVPGLVEAGLRVFVPDQRGYTPGARPEGVDAYHVDRLVEDVVGLLDALGLDRVHLVGHDWGAVVAWTTAARHPDRLLSLTTLSVPHPAALSWAREHDEDQRQASSYMDLLRIPEKAEQVLLEDGARRLRGMFSAPVQSALVDRYVARLQEPGALTGALNWYRAMDRVLRDLGPVEVDTTYVWGVHDPALRRAEAERAGEHVRTAYRFVELPDVDHWIPELAPEVVVTEVLRRVRTR